MCFRITDELHPAYGREQLGGDLHHRGAELHRQGCKSFSCTCRTSIGHSLPCKTEKFEYCTVGLGSVTLQRPVMTCGVWGGVGNIHVGFHSYLPHKEPFYGKTISTLLQNLMQDSTILTGWRVIKLSGEGNILSLAHAGFLHPPCWKSFPEFSRDLLCYKKKEYAQRGIKLMSLGVQIQFIYPKLWCESTKYKILSPP